jgi:hypothetical protein
MKLVLFIAAALAQSGNQESPFACCYKGVCENISYTTGQYCAAPGESL